MASAQTTAEGAREVRIEEQLKGLPAKPGVYLFRDARGGVVYVGGEPAVLEGRLVRADEREIAAEHRVQAARFLD